MAYDNTNRGTIAKNTDKTEDTNSKDGSKFYSLTVKPKEAKAAPKHQSSGNRDDDIGF
jgi:hypothetical protein